MERGRDATSDSVDETSLKLLPRIPGRPESTGLSYSVPLSDVLEEPRELRRNLFGKEVRSSLLVPAAAEETPAAAEEAISRLPTAIRVINLFEAAAGPSAGGCVNRDGSGRPDAAGDAGGVGGGGASGATGGASDVSVSGTVSGRPRVACTLDGSEGRRPSRRLKRCSICILKGIRASEPVDRRVGNRSTGGRFEDEPAAHLGRLISRCDSAVVKE